MVSSIKAGIRVLFFDLDNTLIPTRKADKLACNKLSEILVENYNVPLENARGICANYLRAFRKCPDNPSVNLMQWRHKLWSQALGEQFHSIAGDVYMKWLHLRYFYLSLTPDVIALLTRLRSQYMLGLITNGPSAAQWEKIERINLRAYFDVILVSGDLPWEKPQSRIFHEACEYLGVEPCHCLMVGDKLETDILGGIHAKLGATVWVPLNVDETSNDCEPDYTIEHVTDLLSVLPETKGFSRNKHRNLDLDDCNSNSSDGS